MENVYYKKVTIEKYTKLYNENVDKFLMISDNEETIGTAIIDKNALYNKIEININKDYRGYGYGKILFIQMLNKYIELYGYENLRFEVEYENITLKRILSKNGALQIDNNDGGLVFMISLKKWSVENNKK